MLYDLAMLHSLADMAERLWLQVWSSLRVVIGRIGNGQNLPDKQQGYA